MHYSQEGSYAIVCISQKPDVTLYEAFNFLEKFKQGMNNDGSLHSEDLINSKDAQSKFKHFGKKVTEFITEWNANPKNRDLTYIVF